MTVGDLQTKEPYPNMPKSLDEFYQEILKTLDFYGITLSEKEIGKLFKITSFNIGLIVGERSKQ